MAQCFGEMKRRTAMWISYFGKAACKKPALPDIKAMSTQEILIEEIKHQPEPVLRELRHYLDVLKHRREPEAPMEGVVADTWEKLGPAPEIDYDRL